MLRAHGTTRAPVLLHCICQKQAACSRACQAPSRTHAGHTSTHAAHSTTPAALAARQLPAAAHLVPQVAQALDGEGSGPHGRPGPPHSCASEAPASQGGAEHTGVPRLLPAPCAACWATRAWLCFVMRALRPCAALCNHVRPCAGMCSSSGHVRGGSAESMLYFDTAAAMME